MFASAAVLALGPSAVVPLTPPASVPVLEIPLAVNLVAVAVGALVGTLRAGESDDIDVVGMFGLALCFGFGGGVVRDILLGYLPPAAFRNPAYIATVLVMAVIGSIFLVYLDQLEKPLWILDSLSIGLFAAVGVNSALLTGLAFLPAVFVGALASVGGLVIADAMQARPSALLHRGPPNVMAGLAGAIVYALLFDKTNTFVVTVLAVLAAFAVRVSGALWGVRAPMPLKDPRLLRGRVRSLWSRVGIRWGGEAT